MVAAPSGAPPSWGDTSRVETVFPQAFAAPAAFWDPERGERVLTERFEVGMLPIPTGRLAIHDPGYDTAPDALDRSVMPGLYRVDRILRSWTAPDGKVRLRSITAAVRISFGGGEAELHVPVRSSDGNSALVFGVDSGLISIFDRSLLRTLAGKALLDTVPDDLPDRSGELPPAAIVAGPGGTSLLMCQAGKGDGAYRAWWGLDADDDAVELIVDFGELTYSRWRTVEFPSSALLDSANRLRLALAGSGLEYEPVPFESFGIPPPPLMSDDLVAFSRPAGQLLELRLLDGAGTVIGSPGHVQLFPGPWLEVLERELVQRASTVRVRIHEGNVPLEPLEG
jgi:uncharacterized protein DUF4241